MLAVGALAVAVSAFLAGTSGFGFGLVATPVLLLLGFSVPFVVTVNLLVVVATRVSVGIRLRRSLDHRRSALLVAAAVPGLYLGARVLDSVDQDELKVAAGLAVAALAAASLLVGSREARPAGRAVALAAGFAGGFLGTTTSLVGVVPALVFARARLAAATFFADMAVYQLAAAAIGLGLLAANGRVSGDAFLAFAIWLPGVLAGNLLGTTVGLRLPHRAFHAVTLGFACAAGILTAATASG